MALQYRRNVEEDSSDESDEDYVLPEQVEMEDEESESDGADLEPSSGGDTDLDIGKRKRKRKTRCRTQNGKKKQKTEEFSDNNDETTSNETLLSLPLRNQPSMKDILPLVDLPTEAVKPAWMSTTTSSGAGYSSSTPSPGIVSTSDRTSSHFSRRSEDTSAKEESGDTLSPPRSSAVRPSESSALGSVLAKLSGKKKSSTLEKSKMDWQKYKSTEGLEEDLAQYNKGKGGYLDRKDFLDRSTAREYDYTLNLRSPSFSGKRPHGS